MTELIQPAAKTATGRWWPSRYGPDDQAGALNEISPAKVVEAVGLVRRGQVYDLAHVLDENIPVFPGRTFRQRITENPGEPVGRNRVHWVAEQITATQQLGTHVDALNHLHDGERTYNGFALSDILGEHGTTKLGVDTLPQIVTRGLLLDIAGMRGVERLGPGEVIKPRDAEAALRVDGLSVRPGDAVFFHTGWGGLWGRDNAAYAAGEPGPGMSLGRWLARHRVAVTGCDTWSFGPYPPEDPDEPFVVPQVLNTRHGVVVVENLRLEHLARALVREFLLVISHAKPRGATGAWVTPLAII